MLDFALPLTGSILLQFALPAPAWLPLPACWGLRNLSCSIRKLFLLKVVNWGLPDPVGLNLTLVFGYARKNEAEDLLTEKVPALQYVATFWNRSHYSVTPLPAREGQL
jgi:hypothetical protein